MSADPLIEKTIPKRIFERLVEKLKGSSDFPETILNEFSSVDLTDKTEVKRIISMVSKAENDEDTQTGNKEY